MEAGAVGVTTESPDLTPEPRGASWRLWAYGAVATFASIVVVVLLAWLG